jgi:threonine/homoserine/homoserine lactone efflux protein
MSDIVTALVPEMLGLVVTPAAIVACLILLGSSHPVRNVAVFASVYIAVYAVFSAVVVAVGQAAGSSSDSPGTTRGWISLVLGVLFLAAGLITWLRGNRKRPVNRVRTRVGVAMAERAGVLPDVPADDTEIPDDAPGWVRGLADPKPRLVLIASLVLSVVNPNVAILLSGLGIVITADVSSGQQVVGVALLLGASLLDFVVPTVAFLVSGAAGRARLRRVTMWLIRHNQVLGIVVLIAFGLLFSVRGIALIV